MSESECGWETTGELWELANRYRRALDLAGRREDEMLAAQDSYERVKMELDKLENELFRSVGSILPRRAFDFPKSVLIIEKLADGSEKAEFLPKITQGDG